MFTTNVLLDKRCNEQKKKLILLICLIIQPTSGFLLELGIVRLLKYQLFKINMSFAQIPIVQNKSVNYLNSKLFKLNLLIV